MLHDGYAIVSHADQLPSGQRRALKAWELEGELAVIAVAGDEQVEPIRLSPRADSSRARSWKLAALTAFRDRWFQELRG